MGKNRIVTVRMDADELKMLDNVARAMERNKSDALRLCLLFVYVYFTSGLTFAEVLKPLPEVMEYLEERAKEETKEKFSP